MPGARDIPAPACSRFQPGGPSQHRTGAASALEFLRILGASDIPGEACSRFQPGGPRTGATPALEFLRIPGASDIPGEACSRFPRGGPSQHRTGAAPALEFLRIPGASEIPERPVLVSCREGHSSTELGLPQHGNFSELQTPVAHWKGHRTGRARDFSS